MAKYDNTHHKTEGLLCDLHFGVVTFQIVSVELWSSAADSVKRRRRLCG
jgi:hypothetical protein